MEFKQIEMKCPVCNRKLIQTFNGDSYCEFRLVVSCIKSENHFIFESTIYNQEQLDKFYIKLNSFLSNNMSVSTAEQLHALSEARDAINELIELNRVLKLSAPYHMLPDEYLKTLPGVLEILDRMIGNGEKYAEV